MSSAQDQTYFGDGLAEELLNLLTKNPALQVAARTSSFRFRDGAASVTDIAKKLQVAYVLEGSVRREADKLRVTAQLISAKDGFHVWSDTYDETFDDVFSIQDRIAAQIARAMETNVLEDQPVQHTNSDAFLMYLRASQLAREGSRETLQGAAELFEQVVEIDPTYAPAWSRLSNTYSNLAGQGHLDYSRGFELALEAAQRAVTSDPEYAGGYLQLSWLAHRYQGDLATASSAMQTALDLEPRNVSTLRSAAVLLLQLGQLNEAIEVLTYCAQRSPLDPRGFHNLGIAQKYADRLPAAMISFEKTLSLSPDYHGTGYQIGETLLLLDRPGEAAAYFAELEDHRPLLGQALVEHARGNNSASDAALAELTVRWGERWPGTIADAHAFRGEPDLAFEWLEKDFEKFGAAGWGELKLQRLLDNIKDDPRWTVLLQRANATDQQLSAHKLDIPTWR